MRVIKQYGGIFLILIAVGVLCASFLTGMDQGVYNWILLGAAAAVILGVVLCVLGGKAADKIGGK